MAVKMVGVIAVENGNLKKVTMSLIAITLALTVSACGRKGPLEPPPSAQLVTDEATQDAPKPEKPDNPFFLDPLI